MSALLDPHILLTGLLIFTARICDVAIGTIRTIITVQGRTAIAFVLATVEITIWISVVSTVIKQVDQTPVLIVFYSLGYASGNVLGIMVERKLAFGMIILKVFSSTHGLAIAEAIRAMGQAVTIFHGEGMKGPVCELYIACRRREVKRLLTEIERIESGAFYVIEQARDVRKVLRPVCTPLGGWRARHKRK